MSLSFLPSYLRNWIEAEINSKEQECDLQESIDDEYDWVLLEYRNQAGKQLNELLQDYIVLQDQQNVRNVDDEWFDVGQRTAKCAERSRKAARRARKRAKRHADRYELRPYH